MMGCRPGEEGPGDAWIRWSINLHQGIRSRYGEALETQQRDFATDVLVKGWLDFVQSCNGGSVDSRVMGNVDEVMVGTTGTGKVVAG
jgi:hypothetical protein